MPRCRPVRRGKARRTLRRRRRCGCACACPPIDVDALKARLRDATRDRVRLRRLGLTYRPPMLLAAEAPVTIPADWQRRRLRTRTRRQPNDLRQSPDRQPAHPVAVRAAATAACSSRGWSRWRLAARPRSACRSRSGTMIDQGFARRRGGGAVRSTAPSCSCSLVAVALALRHRARASTSSRCWANAWSPTCARQLYAHLIGAGRRLPRPHPQRRTGLAPHRRRRAAAQRRGLQHVGGAAQHGHGDRQPGDAVRDQLRGWRPSRWSAFRWRCCRSSSAAGGCGRSSRASQDRVADANTLAAETLGAVRTVQAHAREALRTRPLRRRADRSPCDTARAPHPARRRWVTAIAIIAGVRRDHAWCCGRARTTVLAGRMSAGTLAQFVLYALIGGGSVGALAEVWNELQRAAGGMGRISELLQRKPPPSRAPAHPQPLPRPLRGELASRTSTFHYPLAPRRAGAATVSACDVASRRDRGAGRAVRRRQEHGVLDAAALPRPAVRAASASTASTIRAAGSAGTCASASRWCRSSRRSSPPARARTSATAAWTPATRDVRSPPSRPRTPTDFIAALPRGLRHRTGRTRRAPVRRPAAAHRHRPGAAEGRADPAAGRSHQRARCAERARGAAGAGSADGRPHHPGHRAPPGDRAEGRPHRGDGPRPHRRRRARTPQLLAAGRRCTRELATLQFLD